MSNNIYWIPITLFCCTCLLTLTGAAQNVTVDDSGVMRWQDGSEVHGFGVNYTVPFAHAYRSAKKLGVDPLRAIDQDVYHLARLRLDLYRVHVWDTEISDTLGNLLFNEHLHAFDYLLMKLGERDINYVLTPIAFWGGGWPEPDTETPGFSHKYGKGDCLTNPDAIRAQENYLTQFMSHVNPYTGIAYKDDPRLIAMEISNEPHHREDPQQVTAFVRKMVDAVRRSGYAGPVFYNTSHSVHLAENYFAGGIQGGTFQWYPTGLGYQRELQGNFLPNVDDYKIPFDDVIREHGGAKLVYEFDGADVGRSYIYPAMARSFREAGIQIATHFSYDPMFLAHANTEYNTHHMNLAYTPQKALSLRICKEIFHRVPLYADYGSYPDNTAFDAFTVSSEKDLATCNTPEKFIYTNNTSLQPQDPDQLSAIAGSGSSPVMSYDGSGAYFLDKLEDGIWRLEVMPDAMIVSNPYGRNSLDKTVAVIQWNTRMMDIALPDLGEIFTIQPLDAGNMHTPEVSDGQFEITPGAYLVARDGVEVQWDGGDKWGNITLGEFHAPVTTVDKTYVVHSAPEAAIAGTQLTIEADIISPGAVLTPQVWVQTGWRGTWLDMDPAGPHTYTATISAEHVEAGILNYYIIVRDGDRVTTFPPNQPGMPFEWDFYDRTPYRVRVQEEGQPIHLFDAAKDWSTISRRWWSPESEVIPAAHPHDAELRICIDSLSLVDNENLNAEPIYDYSIRCYVNDKVRYVREALAETDKLVLRARSLDGAPKPIQVAAITSDGNAWGAVVELSTNVEEHAIPFSALKKVPLVTMPRPYPTFLPYFFEGSSDSAFDPAAIEGVQISIGPGVAEEAFGEPHNIGIVGVWVE